jgi:hypothetical protein
VGTTVLRKHDANALQRRIASMLTGSTLEGCEDTAMPGATHKKTENFTFPPVIKLTILLNKKRETTKLLNKKREITKPLNKKRKITKLLNKKREITKLLNKKREITKLLNKKREITKLLNKKREITKLLNMKREITKPLEQETGKLHSVIWAVPSPLLP